MPAWITTASADWTQQLKQKQARVSAANKFYSSEHETCKIAVNAWTQDTLVADVNGRKGQTVCGHCSSKKVAWKEKQTNVYVASSYWQEFGSLFIACNNSKSIKNDDCDSHKLWCKRSESRKLFWAKNIENEEEFRNEIFSQHLRFLLLRIVFPFIHEAILWSSK